MRGSFISRWAQVGIWILATSAISQAGITAVTVVGYTPGSAPALYQTASAALGPLTGDTTYGGLNPFNPAFDPSQIVVIGAGGSLTLQLSAPAATNGANLGVFSNNGIIDVSLDGSGQADTTAELFSAPSQAVTLVSEDGKTWVKLNGGAAITYANPTNYYLDSEISGYFQSLGKQVADQFQPFLGDLASFNGETYDQMKTTLSGSAGGTWLDLSGTGLSEINYVQFDVPTGSDERMIVDSVSGISTPLPPASWAGCAALAGMAIATARRRSRRQAATAA